MINPTGAFLLFVILTGVFGIFVGLKDQRSKEPILFRKPFLRGCFGLASGLVVLFLFAWNILGALMAIGAIGILTLLQECAIVGITRFRAQRPRPQGLATEAPMTAVNRETWEQIRKKGLARFVIFNTVLYGLAGVVLTGMGFIFAPERLPLYMSITLILAGAVGGATVAIRQWHWHERNERLTGVKPRSQKRTDD